MFSYILNIYFPVFIKNITFSISHLFSPLFISFFQFFPVLSFSSSLYIYIIFPLDKIVPHALKTKVAVCFFKNYILVLNLFFISVFKLFKLLFSTINFYKLKDFPVSCTCSRCKITIIFLKLLIIFYNHNKF